MRGEPRFQSFTKHQMFIYEVYLNNNGCPMTEEVKARSQGEARNKAERMNPGYKAGAAKQVGRA